MIERAPSTRSATRSGPVWLALALASPGAAQNHPDEPRDWAVHDVRLSTEEGAAAHTLVLRDGRIESVVDAALPLPEDCWILEGAGLLAVPCFVDAWTELGCETPGPVIDRDRPESTVASVQVDMRSANRKGIQPAFRAADVLSLDSKVVSERRKAGFGVASSSPGGELLAGSSTLITLRDAPARDLVVRDRVFQHAAFAARGSGYPATLMGFHAQLRQVFLDARHQRDLGARFAAGRPGPRPPWDPDLDALIELLDGQRVVVCQAESAPDILRWLRLADELGLRIAIAGGREAWKVADELARRDVPVLLSLEWGEEAPDPDAPEDEPDEEQASAEEPDAAESETAAEAGEREEVGAEYEYEEPLGVRREKRRLWLERRDGALRLQEAGVRIAFCTAGSKPSELLARVRTLVENGLAREAALAALTAGPAELLGCEGLFGGLRPGQSATFCLWDGDPLAKSGRVRWSFVEGHLEEFELEKKKSGKAKTPGSGPGKGVTLQGVWKVTFDDEDRRELTLELSMAEDGSLAGRARTTNPNDGSPLEAEVSGSVEGTAVELSMTFAVGEVEVTLTLEGDVAGDTMSGESRLVLPGSEEQNRFEATRNPDRGSER